MPKRLRVIVQYLVMILLTALLLWLSLRGLTVGEGENKADFIWRAWEASNKFYLLLMAAVAFSSHVLRAERWRMLLIPTGNKVSLSNSFFSLMIGYLVNLAIPRGGEITRCYNLLKLEKTPVEVSFGTVVVERIVDVLSLILVIAIAFFVEWIRLIAFLNSLGIGSGEASLRLPWWAFVALAAAVGAGAALFLYRKNPKLLRIIDGFRKGLLSVFQIDRKSVV